MLYLQATGIDHQGRIVRQATFACETESAVASWVHHITQNPFGAVRIVFDVALPIVATSEEEPDDDFGAVGGMTGRTLVPSRN